MTIPVLKLKTRSDFQIYVSGALMEFYTTKVFTSFTNYFNFFKIFYIARFKIPLTKLAKSQRQGKTDVKCEPSLGHNTLDNINSFIFADKSLRQSMQSKGGS